MFFYYYYYSGFCSKRMEKPPNKCDDVVPQFSNIEEVSDFRTLFFLLVTDLPLNWKSVSIFFPAHSLRESPSALSWRFSERFLSLPFSKMNSYKREIIFYFSELEIKYTDCIQYYNYFFTKTAFRDVYEQRAFVILRCLYYPNHWHSRKKNSC